jgi:hypothetical protein
MHVPVDRQSRIAKHRMGLGLSSLKAQSGNDKSQVEPRKATQACLAVTSAKTELSQYNVAGSKCLSYKLKKWELRHARYRGTTVEALKTAGFPQTRSCGGRQGNLRAATEAFVL